ncbi:hypothetical protein GCM10023226_38490 [Nocardioides nanhaiensis]|uniref:Putative Flp pilus-assembly TadG-like N-terminal domain-containing protein n=1 Tax=Nocardioides nanhaiensis TaxID=1476871 RepID=A0ABP8WWU4_9ACTN
MTPMIIGFAFVVLLLVATVVDVSAAYLHRQQLDTLADGAALYGADGGVASRALYTDGVTDSRLDLAPAQARAAVEEYLQRVGARQRFPGLQVQVSLAQGSERLEVRVSSPVDLPLTVPGAPSSPRIVATGGAVVDPDPDQG